MKPKEKVKTIEEIVERRNSLHSTKKITLCHGVFDLLHIGHIRHLKEAKKRGDILVVTIIPDIYVNRGPHRPIFNEVLRAEAVAALDWVDYVAINQWPLAVEAIKLIRPDFYVKGAQFVEANKFTKEVLKLEEEAVISVGGELSFTSEIRFSSSNLINYHLPVFSSEVRKYLSNFSARHATRDILQYLDETSKLKVLIVGETIIDEYQYCQAIGKSSKEPTLVVKANSMEKFAGGVLAVANHVANFTDQVSLITFLGDQDSQEDFVRENLNDKVEKIFLYKNDSPTIVKRRYVDSYFFTKLLEVYEINDSALTDDNNQHFCSLLREHIPNFDVVIVLDFGHGMIGSEARDILSHSAPFLALNVQANAGNLGYHAISAYNHADYISIAENEVRLESRDRFGDLQKMVLECAKSLKSVHMSVTRGKYGSLCYFEEDGFFEIPALASRVVDRIGAGDAFLSVTALCVAQKAPMEVVGFIGNAVGALAVATVGNREPIDRELLYKYIESLLK